MTAMLKEDFSPPNLDLDRNFAFQMASIIFRLEQDLRDSSLRQLDITYMHFRVLQYLLDEDGKKIGEIAKAIVARPPVLSRVIDQMEQRKLVRRNPAINTPRLGRRHTKLFITPSRHSPRKSRNRFPSACEKLAIMSAGNMNIAL